MRRGLFGRLAVTSMHAVALAILAALLFSTSPGWAAELKTEKGGAVAPAELERKRREYYTDLKLVTNDGREVRFYSDLLKDKVVLIHFFYVNCKTIAARQSKVLSDLQPLLGDRLGKDIFMVSITVDPANDTPEKVREYARVFVPRPGWTFVTGKKQNVDWINYRLGNYTENPEKHAALFLLGNLRTGHWLKDQPETVAKSLAEHLLSLADEKGAPR